MQLPAFFRHFRSALRELRPGGNIRIHRVIHSRLSFVAKPRLAKARDTKSWSCSKTFCNICRGCNSWHMPPLDWPLDTGQIIQQFESRHGAPKLGGLLRFALAGVNSLYYLDDLDKTYDCSREAIGGHPHDVIDVAHCRWATGTCITALDLCAASLGAAFCNHKEDRELSIADFGPKARHGESLRARLPATALKWIDAVLADVDYQKIKKARRSLTHAMLVRHLRIVFNRRFPERLDLQIDEATRLGSRDLVELARDVATKHVTQFLKDVPSYE